MHRFFLPPELIQGPELVLTDSEAVHASRVLRLDRGNVVKVLNGLGSELRCEISSVGRSEIRLRVLETRTLERLPSRITLLQALPKGKLIEAITQKATELGVHRIVPLLSERVVRHLGPSEARREAEKLEKIAVESIKQCGCPWLPAIETPMTPQQFLLRQECFDLPLVASLEEKSRQPGDCFADYVRDHGRLPESICVWIGPEGDFSPAELAAIRTGGAQPMTLGPFVLRTETAAVYSLSVIQHELQCRRQRP
jgi:16S rRNA (uracil1498-N3)-methyltransferase